MRRNTLLIVAAAAGLLFGAGAAHALQNAEQLRAQGAAAEKADGYLVATPSASSTQREQVADINIQRRNLYTNLAGQRRATIEEVAAATACQTFASRIGPGQLYVLEDGVVRTRNGSEPVPLPAHCR